MKTIYVTLAGLAVCALLIGISLATDPPSVKASRNCRKTIGSGFSNVIKTGVGILDACQGLRDKGKFSGDCNDLAQADVKGKLAGPKGAESKVSAAIAKKCLAGDPVLSNYPNSDPPGAFIPLAVDAVQASGTGLLGSPDLNGDKAKVKCHTTIAKAAAKDIAEVVQGGVKCQNGADKLATQFGSLQSDCVLTPDKSGPKGEAAIAKACTGLGGADVGSCDPLPTCVTDSAALTGRQLAAAIYNPTPGCGNSFVEPGEECDDGNQLNTDGCTNDCKLAKCGDGFVHAGVELCGDSPQAACEDPSPNTCGSITPCIPDGQMRTATVRFKVSGGVSVLGLSIDLDYPETAVRIPGTGNQQTVLDRVTVIPQNGLPGITDLDYEIAVTFAGTDTITPGDFYSVQFDECSSVTPDQFACIVRSAGDGVNDVTSHVSCSVVVQ
jgi:cysteine-rich repeat protein